MRLGTLSVITAALLAMTGGALAQTEPDEIPDPPAPTRPLPQHRPKTALPANQLPPWQTLQGGSGMYYGGWNDYGYGGGCGCGSCGGGCHSCRPGLCCRLQALKSKLCAAWECRKACRSCCKSSCSSCSSGSCCGSDMHGYQEHETVSPSDLPTPPPEPARYDGDDMPTEASPQAAAPVRKRHYTVQRVTATRKSAKKKAKTAE